MSWEDYMTDLNFALKQLREAMIRNRMITMGGGALNAGEKGGGGGGVSRGVSGKARKVQHDQHGKFHYFILVIAIIRLVVFYRKRNI